MSETKQLNVYIPRQLKTALVRASDAGEISIQQLVTNVLGEALDKGDESEFLLASVEEKTTLRRVLAFLRGTKPDEESREWFDLMLRQFERRA